MTKKLMMPLFITLALVLGAVGPSEVAFAKTKKSVQREPASKKKSKKSKKAKKTASSKKSKRKHKY